MKIVVTGGYGFIGSDFVNLIGEKHPDWEIIVVDKLTYAADPNRVTVKHKFIEKDICDLTYVDFDPDGFHFLVNFAAESHVDNSIKDGTPFVKTNVQGTFNLIELARKTSSLIKFVQISTDEVYGDMEEKMSIFAREDDPLDPSSYYSATKASADLLILSAARTYGLPYVITRSCNNFGINQHEEKFIPTIMKNIKNDTPIPLYGDGFQTREWIWVRDNTEYIYDITLTEKTGIYNIGSGQRISNIGLIQSIGHFLDKEVLIDHVEDRLGHDQRYSLDCWLLYTDFGRKPIKLLKTFILENYG